MPSQATANAKRMRLQAKRLRVLTKTGKPIPNMYAAGEVLGFARTSGDTCVGGLSLTSALTFGRLLGQSLVKW